MRRRMLYLSRTFIKIDIQNVQYVCSLSKDGNEIKNDWANDEWK